LKIINQNKIVEVIGRLNGRSKSWRNRSRQSDNELKKQLSLEAAEEMKEFSDMLAEAFDCPKYVKSNKAYKDAVITRTC
jgi:hypothetical protein